MTPALSRTATFRCGYCEATGKSPVEFLVTTEPGAVSEHWCGMSNRWTGTGTSQMQVVHDPGDARGFVFLALLALPTVLAFVVGGIGSAVLVAIGTVVALTKGHAVTRQPGRREDGRHRATTVP